MAIVSLSFPGGSDKDAKNDGPHNVCLEKCFCAKTIGSLLASCFRRGRFECPQTGVGLLLHKQNKI